MKRIFFILLLVVLPHSAGATTIYITSGSTWTVPSDATILTTVECIGGGANGQAGTNASGVVFDGVAGDGGAGGGGGAFSRKNNVGVTPGAVLPIVIGGVGQDTTFNTSICLAKGASGQSGGQAASGIGDIKVSGGSGGSGAPVSASFYGGYPGGGGGGGGGGGPIGSGGSPAAGASGFPGLTGYTGGPGASGGGAGGQGDGTAGGAGGAAGLGGGAISTYSASTNGGNGGAGSEYNPGRGAGGGGGGGGSQADVYGPIIGSGGNGGGYGGGGGGGGGGDLDRGAGGAYIGGSGGSAGQGIIIITYTPTPAPTCSITLTPNPLAYGSSATLTWSSTNANTSMYINNISYVAPSGSIAVQPSATTDYGGTAIGTGGTGTCPKTLTVNPPALPVATISSSAGGTVLIGQSSTITATFAAGSGDALTGDNIDSPVGTGVGANTNPTTPKTSVFSPSVAGTYTFYARAKTGYYTAWATYNSVTVTVPPIPTVTVSASPTTIALGQSATLSWSSTNATSCTITSFSTAGTNGSAVISPAQTTTYTVSCTGNGGTASASATLSVSCTAAYTCSGQTIQYTNTSCVVSNVTTCVAPAFCSTGSSSCLTSPPVFNPGATTTGHLQIRPRILASSSTARVYWNLSNVSSCAVTSSNGDSWTGISSGVSGRLSSVLQGHTIFQLLCTGFDSSQVRETQEVNIAPRFQEK